MRTLFRLLRQVARATVMMGAAIAAASCARIDFTEDTSGGDGGATATSISSSGGTVASGGMGGDGAAISSTGTGCIPSCSADRRCGDDGCMGLCGGIDIDQTWSLRSDVSGLLIEPWPETQSVFFAADTTAVQRIDACTGEVMASITIDTDAPRAIRGVGRYGESLLVAYNDPASAGMEQKQGVVLDARTLTVVQDAFGVGSVEANGYWLGEASPSGLWLNLASAGSFAFVQPGGTYCTNGFVGYDLSRGIVADESRVITAWRATGSSSFSLVELASCADSCCQFGGGPAAVSGPLPTGFEPRVLALKGNSLYAAGFRPDPDPKGACTSVALRAGVLRANLSQVGEPFYSEFDFDGCIDAFTSITIEGPDVFAAGTTEALTVEAGGTAWLARFDANFGNGAQPTAEALIDGAELGWFTAADGGGVYVSGRAAGGGGFLVKCTHDLICPAIPPAGL